MKYAVYAFLIYLGVGFGAYAQVQDSEIYFANPEYILTESGLGQEWVRRREARFGELETLDLEIIEALDAEEDRLTELRAEMSIEEFQSLADAFDTRVTSERARFDELSDQLVAEFNARLNLIFQQIQSEIQGFAEQRKATVLDARLALRVEPSRNLDNYIIARMNQRYEANKEALDRAIFEAPLSRADLTVGAETGSNEPIEDGVNEENE